MDDNATDKVYTMVRYLDPMEHSFLLPFEKTFAAHYWLQWLKDTWIYTFHMSAIYVTAIFLGEYLMRDRKPFSLQKVLAIWNLLLAAMSSLIFIRLSKDVYNSVTEYGSYEAICIQRNIDDPVYSFWTFAFTVSKIPELIDTAFIVLRKRKLLFLHWYHHITVLIYTFYSAQNLTSTGRWFTWMNSFVHMLMYSYYFLTTLQIRPPKCASMTLTMLQTSQMAVGCYVNYLVYTFKSADLYCGVTDNNFLASIAMYFSYLLLFVKFFYDAYIRNKKKNI